MCPNEEPSKSHQKSSPYGEWQESRQEVNMNAQVDLEFLSTGNEYSPTSESDGGEPKWY